MTKRQHYTVEDIFDHLSDEEDDYDPDEPMMEGSDDEFSDLEMDERDWYDQEDLDPPPPSTSTVSGAQPGSPPLSPSLSDTSTSTSPGKYYDTYM